MAVITQRIFTLDGTRNCLKLGSEEFIRPFTFGNNWTKLRISVIWALRGSVDITSSYLLIGVCSGTTNGAGSNTTTNFVGGLFAANETLAYNTDATTPFYRNNGSVGGCAKVGSVISQTTRFGYGNITAIQQGTFLRRSPSYWEITKGSPNYTIAFVYNHPSTGAADYSTANLIEIAECATVNGGGFQVSSQVVAASEAPGPLNAFNLWWNHGPPFELEIYGIAVTRLA